MFRATPSKLWPSFTWFWTVAWRILIGSSITVCIATPLMEAGSAGSVVPNGVRGFVAESATVRSYSVNGGTGGVKAAAVSFSDEPAAFRVSGFPGGIANGVLLNDGKTENEYSDVPAASTGGPEKLVAPPCASTEFPWGMFAILATIWPFAGGFSGGEGVGGWVTQIPGSMCRAPPVEASLIFWR